MRDAFTIPLEKVVSYGAQELRSFHVYGFEWIDNLHFLGNPQTFLGERAEAYITVAKERFKEAGWAGDGEVCLLWLPPFVFTIALKIPPEGVVLWHVKSAAQDGLSYLLSPLKLPFEEFQGVR